MLESILRFASRKYEAVVAVTSIIDSAPAGILSLIHSCKTLTIHLIKTIRLNVKAQLHSPHEYVRAAIHLS